MNYYEHHLGDYAAATAHLSWDEDMAYTRLLRAYYHHERGIPAGQAYRLARASTPAQRKAVDSVLGEFFTLVEGEHKQKRADEEIERFRDKQRKAKASADARWSHTERNANAMRTHSEGNALQTPDTRPIKKTSSPSVTVFEEFWSAYPRKVGKLAALKAFGKHNPPIAQALRAIETQAKSEAWRKDGGQFIPHPSTWLNEGRWQDEGVVLHAVPTPQPSTWLAEQAAHRAAVEAERLAKRRETA